IKGCRPATPSPRCDTLGRSRLGRSRMFPRCWLVIAALLGGSAVGLGAFHAHGLAAWLDDHGVSDVDAAKRMINCETAVHYQLAHAPVILCVGLWALIRPGSCLAVAGLLFSLGVTLFCGGLYLMVFTGQLGHWAIVPSGGLLLIIAWFVVAAAAVAGPK